MKQSTLIILLLLVAAGIGFYLYSEKQKQAAAAPAPGANTIPERGGVSINVTGQIPVAPKATSFELV